MQWTRSIQNCSVAEAVRRSMFSVAFLSVFFLTDMFFEIILAIYVYKVELHSCYLFALKLKRVTPNGLNNFLRDGF